MIILFQSIKEKKSIYTYLKGTKTKILRMFILVCMTVYTLVAIFTVLKNAVHVQISLDLDTGHEIAPDTGGKAPKFSVLATNIRMLVAKLATRTLPYLSTATCTFKKTCAI